MPPPTTATLTEIVRYDHPRPNIQHLAVVDSHYGPRNGADMEFQMTISKKTAMDIALAYREVETAETLLAEITETMRGGPPDIRDAFGRRQEGLQLGVPSGSNGHRLFNVPWTMARPIIEAHLAQQRAVIAVLSEKAIIENTGGDA